MEIFNFNNLVNNRKLKDKELIVTIGVFDGFHIAHQRIVDRMLEKKKAFNNAFTLVITFSINPKPRCDKNIDTLRLREENLEKKGIDYLAVIDFSPVFAKISGGSFIEMLTRVGTLKAIVVGDDFSCGNPSSTVSAKGLDAYFKKLKVSVQVEIMQAILTEGGEKISSTLVRRVIDNGEVGCIPYLTGRNYRVDILNKPFNTSFSNTVFSKASIHQLLPPVGEYNAMVLLKGSKKEVKVSITVDSLILYCSFSEDDVALLDSIYFLEKKK